MKTHNQRSLMILSMALIIVSIGFGMVIPILPFYLEELGGSGVELGLLVAIAAFTELIFGPLWGGLSDRHGRRPILMVGLGGYALSALFIGLSRSLPMLFVGRAIAGILASATTASAMAYAGDSSVERDRGGALGILGAAGGLGLILGPAFGGWLGRVGLATPFYVAAGLSVATVILVALWLPESLGAVARAETGQPLSSIRPRALWGALCGVLGFPLLLVFLASFGLANFEAVFGLYAMARYGYGPERVGLILAVVGLVSALGKVGTGALTRRWGDVVVVKASLLAGSFGYLVLLTAGTFPAVLAATGLFVLSKTFLRPSALALISKRSQIGQGGAMGLGNSFISLGRIIGPLWAGLAFDLNISYPYLSGSAILLTGFLASLLWLSSNRATDASAHPALAK